MIPTCYYTLLMQICVDLWSYTCEIIIVGKCFYKKLGPILDFCNFRLELISKLLPTYSSILVVNFIENGNYFICMEMF